LEGVVLQNRQAIDLSNAEQGETCAILNETCCFGVNTSIKIEESFSVLKKFKKKKKKRSYKSPKILMIEQGHLQIGSSPSLGSFLGEEGFGVGYCLC